MFIVLHESADARCRGVTIHTVDIFHLFITNI